MDAEYDAETPGGKGLLTEPERFVCVFCGSSPGTDPSHAEIAHGLGRMLAEHGIGLVFGGGRFGLMGRLCEGAVDAGGHVVGVIPRHLLGVEVPADSLAELIVVPDMHTRKRQFFDRSDAFCVLPGGLGTLDEMMEILTWTQIGLHRKPVILVNNAGYWDPLIALFRHGIEQGFIKERIWNTLRVVDSVDAVPALVPVRAERAFST